LRLIGSRVRLLREARGLSAEALAERAGLSMRGVLYLEYGQRNIRVLTLLAVAAALEVEPGDLLRG
jgi:transcriptional regulator with XRE-family HTH domain